MEKLIFEHNYILENEVVQLRPLQKDDFNHLKHFAINEPNLWEYSLLQANGLENMQTYFDAAFIDEKIVSFHCFRQT